MTLMTAVGMLRAGGRIRRASFVGYWIISKGGKKRPFPPRFFKQLQQQGNLKKCDDTPARLGAEWVWQADVPYFQMPKMGPRCAGSG
jgi:hypothetical protein